MSSPLRYLIGKDSDPGEADAITVIGYGAETLPINGVGYINPRQESGGRRPGVMYLPEDDIERDYGEPAFVFDSLSFWDNFDPQVAKWKRLGAKAVEIDNLDTYDVSSALKMFNALSGLGVWVKNAAIVDGDQKSLLAHPAAVGCIVEGDCGTPAAYDALRKAAGKPDLPIRFVSYGDGRSWAQQAATQITAAGYADMAVTYSSDGEYGNAENILLPIGSQMAWRLAKSLETLRDQVNALYPVRDKSSDGTIGDASHAATTSDHNPNDDGVVTAMDITHDPAHGLNARKLAEMLVASRDPRIKYIISNAQIISSTVSPWQWRPYSGANAHRAHVHISVEGPAKYADDASPWAILGGIVPPLPAPTGRQMRITATNFNDSQVAYTGSEAPAPGWNSRFGVALPYRFKGVRPKVRVFANGKSIECEIMDIGPWYDGTAARGPFDPYWETGRRPRAESDPRTNGAAIDLTLPADAALGLNGKGLVDWEFVGAVNIPAPPIVVPTNPPATVEEAFARVEAAMADLKEQIQMAQQPVVSTQIDWGKLLQPLFAELLPKILPALLPYIIQLLPQLLPMLLKGMFVEQKPAGMSTGATVGAGAGLAAGGGIIGALLSAFLKGPQ